jgi:hypothetical protein
MYEKILEMLEDIAMRLGALEDRVYTSGQVQTDEGISDITEHFGLMKAGEIRYGIGSPGKPSFTGLRISSTGMSYGDTDYLMAGVDADTMLWGVRSSDGSLEFYTLDVVDAINITSTDGAKHSTLYVNTAGELRYVDSDATDYLVSYATT